jgi:thimet oligopeptidase
MQKKSFVFTMCLVGMTVFAQLPQNPLLIHSNAPIAFDRITAADINEATTIVITDADRRISTIVKGAENGATPVTLKAFDELQMHLSNLSMELSVIAVTYSDDPIRQAAQAALEKLGPYISNIYLNEGLYRALKKYGTEDTIQMPANHRKYLRETILSFEKNGMELEAAERKELEALNNKIITFGLKFDNNIAENKDSIIFRKEDLRGVPKDVMKPWERPDGRYVVPINTPSVYAILRNAESSESRRKALVHFSSQAYPQNVTVLDSLLYYRNAYAQKLGFRSYAEYVLKDKMAATPENVWKFQNDLVEKLKPLAETEATELAALKKKLHPDDGPLQEWDTRYLHNKLLDTKYNLNVNEVNAYFEMNHTLAGMFGIYEKLLGVKITETKSLPVWDSKVRTYDIFSNGKKAGSFYLDLYPRPNKFNHFACFPLRLSSGEGDNAILPGSALLCNFTEGTAKEPSLMPHGDVETLFHEFGHLIHSMLSRSDIASQSGFALKQDFVEAPSQFLENWCWEYEPLKQLSRHYKTGAALPRPLFDKIKQTQLVGVGMQNLSQLVYGLIDLTFEDRYDLVKAKGAEQVEKDISGLRPVPHTDGTHFIYGFGHLNGYAAQYYGYLWSKVFAQDMFTVFQKNGFMDTASGIRYRLEILEKGASVSEMDMLRNFLGREPNSDAFLRSLGIGK